MKKLLYTCIMAACLLPLTAQATLSSDLNGIDGINGTFITGFNQDNVLTSSGYPHFSGVVVGDIGFEFLVDFYFFEVGSVDYLEMRVGPNGAGSGYIDTLNFSVTFDDLDFGSSLILTGVTPESDTYVDNPFYDPVSDPDPGLINPTIPPSGHTLTLAFQDFFVSESRTIELSLITEVDSGGGPSNPIPEPATMALLGMGVVGLAVRRKFV